MEKEKNIDELVKKVQSALKGGQLDLSLEEDLSIAVMNLVSIEEHLYFTGVKTDKAEYFDLLNEVRQIRKEMLARMIDVHEGETWCISKHLLAATMRMIEVGTKYQQDGKKEEAQRVFALGGKVYNMFWGLRLKLFTPGEVQKIADSQLNVHDAPADGKWSLDDITKKLLNCCNE